MWIVALILGVAFFIIEHDPRQSTREDYSLDSEEMVTAVESGSVLRQIGYLALGGLGVFFLARREGRKLRFDNPLAVLLMLYFGWCLASLAWSTDPSLTLRRLIVLGLACIGVVGISRGLSRSDVCTLVLTLTTASAAIGILVELAQGNFRPWVSGYRFSGTLHPNNQGVYCGAFFLAALSKAIGEPRWRRWYVALACAAAGLILLSKCRAAVAGLALAVPALMLAKTSVRTRVTLLIAGATAISAGALFVSLFGTELLGSAANAVLLGRTEEADSLSGRVPLWEELLGYVKQRPLTGFGYDSFWTPVHIDEVTAACEWPIHSAHSAFIDALLSVGLVGECLLIAVVGTTLVLAARRHAAGGDEGATFLFGVLLFALVNSTMESGFAQPELISILAACCAGQIAFCVSAEPAARPADSAARP